MFRKGLGNLN